MAIDAIILSGGRGSRLGGLDKGALLLDGETLLARTLTSVADCRHVVVAGTVPEGTPNVIAVREEPPFSGPAAGVVAALQALPDPASGDRILLLACDLRHPAELVAALRDAPAEPSVVIRDDGRDQYLAGIHDAAALRDAASLLPDAGADASLRQLLGPLHSRPLDVPDGTAADVDTWADAAFAGVTSPEPDYGELQ